MCHYLPLKLPLLFSISILMLPLPAFIFFISISPLQCLHAVGILINLMLYNRLTLTVRYDSICNALENASFVVLKAKLHYALFHSRFLFFLAFFLAFLTSTKTRGKTQENSQPAPNARPTRAQCKKMFLYYTMHWVKT